MSTDFQRVEKAILYLEQNFLNQPSLLETADHVHVSPFHFQRIFSDWAGISPKKFLQVLTLNYLKKTIAKTSSNLELSFEANLSSPSRVHDLFVQIEGVTPEEYRSAGKGIVIHYKFFNTVFGNCLAAETERGICHMSFFEDSEEALMELQSEWPNAILKKTDALSFNPETLLTGRETRALKLFAKGTNFQVKVWNALLKIPEGGLVTYDSISEIIGMPGASRAVGTAIGNNHIAWLIPCHRVIRKTGVIGNYKWGTTRKKAMIAFESCKSENVYSEIKPD
jgi:AraC family transcriptional regulator, regulatory protein of adaptative response / methylated-DNA-[protein]-cysteine methyltransferase